MQSGNLQKKNQNCKYFNTCCVMLKKLLPVSVSASGSIVTSYQHNFWCFCKNSLYPNKYNLLDFEETNLHIVDFNVSGIVCGAGFACSIMYMFRL